MWTRVEAGRGVAPRGGATGTRLKEHAAAQQCCVLHGLMLSRRASHSRDGLCGPVANRHAQRHVPCAPSPPTCMPPTRTTRAGTFPVRPPPYMHGPHPYDMCRPCWRMMLDHRMPASAPMMVNTAPTLLQDREKGGVGQRGVWASTRGPIMLNVAPTMMRAGGCPFLMCW